ncbi:MAG TPA: competence/damage-inducible protein A [Sulfurimonas sp.]|nr:competence/damage-inducible protein A [Sulfurimonas sp.]
MKEPNIYAVIIGSEILDRRREDKHFDYLSKALESKGFSLFASLTIKDNISLIQDTYTMIKNDPKSLMFSFGGIGSTPDDLTRQISANVFSDTKLYRHPTFEKDIINRLQERAYPHPIKMSDLPKQAELLFNPINNMSGFQLDERFFFMPGFPEMARPMIDEIVNTFLPPALNIYTKGFIAECGEGKIQGLMINLDKKIELSSLPMITDTGSRVEFSLSSKDHEVLNTSFKVFTDFLKHEEIRYTLI